MSGYRCTRCLRTDDAAREKGCANGPCPMALDPSLVDPKLVIDSKGRCRVTVPKGTVVFLNTAPARLVEDTQMEIHFSSLHACPIL